MRAAWRGQPGYPQRFDALGASAPKRVYFEGPGWSPEPSAVGVVGARRASEAGRAWARALGGALAATGRVVVSGGALGIDAAAHRGALDASGQTLVVLPTPVSAPAPAGNRPLFREILERGGTLLSEYEVPLGRHTFAERNRLIAALSELTVVVEARERSGTRHTAEAAAALGRPLLVKRWPPQDPRGEAARAFVSQLGAQAIDTPEEVLERLEGRAPEMAAVAGGGLFGALEAPSTLDALAARLGRPEGEVALELLELELEGRVTRSAGRWRRC